MAETIIAGVLKDGLSHTLSH